MDVRRPCSDWEPPYSTLLSAPRRPSTPTARLQQVPSAHWTTVLRAIQNLGPDDILRGGTASRASDSVLRGGATMMFCLVELSRQASFGIFVSD